MTKAGHNAVSRVLPSGTITFLYTDIESSSQAWMTHPDSMPDALSLHDTLLRTAIADSNGAEVKHTGDGLLAAFTSATDALAGAVACQRALQRATWPAGLRLKVRIGLHTGEATALEHDYFGETVTRVARVMDAGNGDQTLCSDATWQLITGATANLSALDLGEYELKGLGNERLHRLRHPDLIDDESALRAKPAGSRALPRNLQSFVGRSQTLADLVVEVGASRLVTLMGVGGIGKSRLAIELARAVSDSFPDGVYWCALAPVSAGDDVANAIATIVGITPRTGMTTTQSLAAALDNQKALLIIDNCEHVSDAAASLISEILDTTIGPSIIATSRRALRVTAEHVWPVAPLADIDDQVRLFKDRARERDPGFAPSPEEIAAIREICRRLDGLPLAVELAAARVRLMAPSVMLERIDDRFALLGSRRDGTAHRLRDTVQWSYEQLSEHEAELFRSLSVFAGGFTLKGAMAVLDSVDEFDLLDDLQTLVDDSLVQRSGQDSDRFMMLETLRQFGFEELENGGERDRIDASFAAYVAQVVATNTALVNTPDEFVGFDGLESEHHNIRQVYLWLVANEQFDQAAALVGQLYYYAACTLQFEVCDWARELVEGGHVAQHSSFGDVAATASYGFYAKADLEPALAIALQGVTQDATSGPSNILGTMAALGSGKLEQATELLDAVLQNFDEQPAPAQFWLASWKALYLHWIDGDPAAREWAERADEAAQVCGGPTATAGGAWILGVVATQNNPTQAVEHFRLALKRLGPRAGRNLIGHTVLEALAVVLTASGTAEEALAACRDNLVATLENDWVAATVDISSTISACLRGDLVESAAQLVGAAEAAGVFVRGRNFKALAVFDEDLVGTHRSEGRERSLRQALQHVVRDIETSLLALG